MRRTTFAYCMHFCFAFVFCLFVLLHKYAPIWALRIGMRRLNDIFALMTSVCLFACIWDCIICMYVCIFTFHWGILDTDIVFGARVCVCVLLIISAICCCLIKKNMRDTYTHAPIYTYMYKWSNISGNKIDATRVQNNDNKECDRRSRPTSE